MLTIIYYLEYCGSNPPPEPVGGVLVAEEEPLPVHADQTARQQGRRVQVAEDLDGQVGASGTHQGREQVPPAQAHDQPRAEVGEVGAAGRELLDGWGRVCAGVPHCHG